MKIPHLAFIVLTALLSGGPTPKTVADSTTALPPILRNKIYMPSSVQIEPTLPAIRRCHLADGRMKPGGDLVCTLWSDTRTDMVFWFVVTDPKTTQIRGVYELTGKGQRKVWPK